MRARWWMYGVVLVLLACDGRGGGTDKLQAGVATPPHPREIEREFLSDPFHIDRLYESMMGPVTQRLVRLLPSPRPELLWLTGYRVEVVGEDGATPEAQEFECHTNLAWTVDPTPAGFSRARRRTFTLTQGQTDVRLPRGFGIPILSSERLIFNSQSLNLNQPDIDTTIQHRARVRFVRQNEIDEPMTPLVPAAAQVMTSLDGESHVFQVAHPDETLAQATCSLGENAEGSRVRVDRFGRRFSPHWVVEPGRSEYRTLVTQQLRIPYDTTIHFIGVHVHPYSESLELHDLTTGETVWKSEHESREDGLGLEWMDYYSSEEGIPIHGDHSYQLISVYDNPTDEATTAMASMFIYYRDREFELGQVTGITTSEEALSALDRPSETKGDLPDEGLGRRLRELLRSDRSG